MSERININEAAYEISQATDTLHTALSIIAASNQYHAFTAGQLCIIFRDIIERVGTRLETAHFALGQGLMGVFPMFAEDLPAPTAAPVKGHNAGGRDE